MALCTVLTVLSSLPLKAQTTTLSIADREVRMEAIRFAAHAQAELEKRVLRERPIYKRMTGICTNPGFSYSQLKYTVDSAKQVAKLGFFNESEVKRTWESRKFISSELAADLEDDGFALAMKECGYSSGQVGWIITSLVSADLAGKGVGTLGLIGFWRVVGGRMMALRAKSPKLFNLLMGTSIAASTYELINKDENDPQPPSPGSTVLTSTEDLNKAITITDDKSRALEINRLTILALTQKMDDKQTLLKNSVDEKQKQQLNSEIRNLQIRITAVQMRTH